MRESVMVVAACMLVFLRFLSVPENSQLVALETMRGCLSRRSGYGAERRWRFYRLLRRGSFEKGSYILIRRMT